MRKLLSVLAAAMLTGCASIADAGALADIAIVNRSTGERLQVYRHGGRLYVEGRAGERYAVELRNRSGGRVLTVLSVDGVNAVSGQTAATSQGGYVLDAWGRAEIAGWRKNMSDVAAFYFTALPDSYAARTGRPDNVGVIGVAVYKEYVEPPLALQDAPALAKSESAGRLSASDVAGRKSASDAAGGESAAAGARPAPAAAAPAPTAQADAATAPSESAARRNKMTEEKLGTGHGRNEASRVSVVDFERASNTPVETVAIHYDRRENLVALGVLPARTPRFAGREPDPFPDTMRFVPDPGR